MTEKYQQYEYDEMQIMKFRGKWCVQAHIEAHDGFYVRFGFEEDAARKLMNDTKFVSKESWKFYHYLEDSNYDPDECFEDAFKQIIINIEYKNTIANNAAKAILKKLGHDYLNTHHTYPSTLEIIKTEVLKVL